MSTGTLDVEALGAQLGRAWSERTPIPPLSESVNLSDIDDAYRVQQAFTRLRLAAGDRMVGRKIGLTSEAVQQQLGVDQPDFGNLWASRYFQGRGGQIEVPADLFLQPRVEGELAFRIGSALRGPGVGLRDVLAATEAVAYSLEIVDSRIENWRIKLADTVADNASFGGFCHADWQPELLTRDLSTLSLTLSKNGQPAGTGSGAACLGNPALAVAWLVNTLARFGVTLQPGDIVMSGAWMPVVPAAQGDVFVLEGEGGSGALTLRFV
ncbi:2-keto-4-pentenoate hydratase [Deinococcus sp.]|uniref:2-keto-4-pentenoate hydratase n=1 Tax=Deinococcus sp. TaxID=47478 RepID=UPI003C7AA837